MNHETSDDGVGTVIGKQMIFGGNPNCMPALMLQLFWKQISLSGATNFRTKSENALAKHAYCLEVILEKKIRSFVSQSTNDGLK